MSCGSGMFVVGGKAERGLLACLPAAARLWRVLWQLHVCRREREPTCEKGKPHVGAYSHVVVCW